MPHTYVAIHICTNSYNGAQYSSLTAWLYMYPYSSVYLGSLYHELQQTLMVNHMAYLLYGMIS